MSDETRIERAIARAFRPRRRLSRRMFLRQSGRGALIAGSALSVDWKGESEPAVATGDGV